jgi:hypothetical protein
MDRPSAEIPPFASGQVWARHFGLHEKAMESALLTLLEITRLIEGDDDAAALDCGIGTVEPFTAHQLKHRIEAFLGEVDDAMGA